MKKHYRIDFQYLNSDNNQFIIVHADNTKEARELITKMNLDIVILSIKKLSY